jgi:hypothetical protein
MAKKKNLIKFPRRSQLVKFDPRPVSHHMVALSGTIKLSEASNEKPRSLPNQM